MTELNKEKTEKLIAYLVHRITTYRTRAKAYALEGNAQLSMVASIQEAEASNILDYIRALLQDG